MKKFLCFLVMIISYQSFSQLPPNSFLLNEHNPDNWTYNPDSVYVLNNGSIQEFYAKGYFSFQFDNYVIDHYPAKLDTTLIFGWDDIDSTYNALRASFHNLETHFGDFELIKVFNKAVDSTQSISKLYLVKFNNYKNIKLVLDSMSSITGINNCKYENHSYTLFPFRINHTKMA